MVDELRGPIAQDGQYLQYLINESNADIAIWTIVATVLVMLMQGGFLLLEAGSVRSKNTIHVAQKNVTDLVVSGCIFLTFGCLLMFGVGATGLFGFGGVSFADPTEQQKLIYQFGFCAAAATIMSGALAERLKFRAYVILTVLMAALTYPVFGHLVWGNHIVPDNPSFLTDMGFLDYAGGSVVHIVGGAAALGACLVLGPRIGRYDEDGQLVDLPGHSSIFSLIGVLVLAISWIGFNAGTAEPGTANFAQIVLNTVVAMCFGGAAALAIDLIRNPRATHPRTTSTGILGGLVAITAGCAFVDFYGALLIGLAGGCTAILGADFLARVVKIDDPVDVIAVHGLGGFMGTIMLAFFVASDHLIGSRLEQAMIQTLGASLAAIWAFCVTFVAAKFLDRCFGMRVSKRDELLGLNFSEHNSSFGIGELNTALEESTDTTPYGGAVEELIAENQGDLVEQDVAVVGQMLTANKQAKEQLAEKTQQFDDYERVGTDWLWETDSDLNISFLSRKFHKVFGDKVSHIIGRPYLSFLQAVSTPIDDHAETLEAREIFDDEVFRVTGLDGKERTFSVSAVPRFDKDGDFKGYRGRSLDITAKIQAENEIRYLALHDTLTGLLNRYAFYDEVSKLVSSDVGEPKAYLAIFSMDLNGFKAVNDSFGHQVGDQLLCIVADRIKEFFSDGAAVVSRLGGDEFVVALPIDDEAEASLDEQCSALLKSVRATAEINGLRVAVSASIGMSLYPKDSQELGELMRFSDLALYEAKNKETKHWVKFGPEMQAKLLRRSQLEIDMKSGIANNEFYTVYQPQVEIATGKVTGFEALLRWRHHELGEVSPAEFIRIAEDTGMITQLGSLVMRDALKTASNWPTVLGDELKICVNVSPQQFFGQDLISEIKRALEDAQLDPQRLEIEITEGTLVRDSDVAIQVLTALRNIGIDVAVDDFGTGYSSLSYLQKFPLDRLKIDRAFVTEIDENENDQRITGAIIDLGRSLGLNVIAEGVERESQLNQLRELNCHEFQGFLYSPPVCALSTISVIEQAMTRRGIANGGVLQVTV